MNDNIKNQKEQLKESYRKAIALKKNNLEVIKKLQKIKNVLALTTLSLSIIGTMAAEKNVLKTNKLQKMITTVEEERQMMPVLVNSNIEYISDWSFNKFDRTFYRFHKHLNEMDPWDDQNYLEIGKIRGSEIVVTETLSYEEAFDKIAEKEKFDQILDSNVLFFLLSTGFYFLVRLGNISIDTKEQKEKEYIRKLEQELDL